MNGILSLSHVLPITGSSLEERDFQQQLEIFEAINWKNLYKANHQVDAQTFTTEIVDSNAFIIPSEDILAFNRVIGLGMSSPANPQHLKEIIQLYKTHEVSRFFLPLSPFAEPSNLCHLLEKEGFSFHNNWVKLYRKANIPIPYIQTDLTIEQITIHERPLFSSIIANAFQWPERVGNLFAATIGQSGYYHFIAKKGDYPIAAASLFVKDTYAYLVVAGTLPTYRKLGAQGALLAKRIRIAQELGCRYLISETGENKPDKPNASYRNMRRFGFEVAYLRPNYIYYL